MKTIAVRLTDGQDLYKEIQALAAEHAVTAGVIISAVGGLTESRIRTTVIDGKIKHITPTDTEIINLHGTVSVNGCHLHISVSDVAGKVMGGHIKEGCTVRMTCELVIGILDDTTFNRENDPQTGFEELVVS